MITPHNVIRHEWIGLSVMVVSANNPDHIGISGTVIDETRNTLQIRSSRGVKIVPKQTSKFRLILPDGTVVEVQGSSIVMAPEKRISMRSETTRGR